MIVGLQHHHYCANLCCHIVATTVAAVVTHLWTACQLAAVVLCAKESKLV